MNESTVMISFSIQSQLNLNYILLKAKLMGALIKEEVVVVASKLKQWPFNLLLK